MDVESLAIRIPKNFWENLLDLLRWWQEFTMQA